MLLTVGIVLVVVAEVLVLVLEATVLETSLCISNVPIQFQIQDSLCKKGVYSHEAEYIKILKVTIKYNNNNYDTFEETKTLK